MKDKDTHLLVEAYQKIISERRGARFYKIAEFQTDDLKFDDYPNFFTVYYKVKRNYVDDSDFDREYGYGHSVDLLDEEDEEITIQEWSEDDPDTTIREQDAIEQTNPELFKRILNYANGQASDEDSEPIEEEPYYSEPY